MAKRGKLNQTLENEMWRACDILRRDNNIGGVMAYTEHLAWLLFLKFLDVEEKKRAEEAAFGESEYEPVLQGDLAWDYWASPKALVNWNAEEGELVRYVRGTLLPGLVKLSGSPLARTIAKMFSDEGTGDQNVLRTIPVCSSDYNLKDVIDIVNSINFERDDDVFTITDFYEQLLARMGAESGTGGEFHTPRPVIRFMVDVIDPEIGETIYDPACGSAGFLAQAYLHMEDKAKTVQDHKLLQEETFYGKEKKGLAALLGTMNLVLHGVTNPNISRENTLEESMKGSVGGHFDIILTNPPFGGTEGRHIQDNFPVRNNATELLFLQHILKKLKKTPNARAGIVVPEGTLFRGGSFADVKKLLLEDFHLFGVISLPPGTFAPYSDVKTALLFFKRPEDVLECNPIARQETWFYEMTLPKGLKKFSKGNPIADEYFIEPFEMWKKWKSYLAGEGDYPFAHSANLRALWQAYFDWVTDQKSLKTESNSEVRESFRSSTTETPKPGEPYTSWIETINDLRERGYDLSARNPNEDERITLPHPAEITARLLERTREFQSIVEHIHSMVSNGENEQ